MKAIGTDCGDGLTRMSVSFTNNNSNGNVNLSISILVCVCVCVCVCVSVGTSGDTLVSHILLINAPAAASQDWSEGTCV